jgi:hypothetical protein
MRLLLFSQNKKSRLKTNQTDAFYVVLYNYASRILFVKELYLNFSVNLCDLLEMESVIFPSPGR